MGNPFVHIELMTTDLAKAKEFYGKLFSWQLEDMQMPNHIYTMIKVGQGTGGGMMKNPMPGAPTSWVPYVDVDDLDAATTKAKSLGGKICKEKTDVMDHGSFVILSDPTGGMLGLWQKKKA